MFTSSKRLQIDHLIHMSDEAAPLPTFDDLADSALDVLDLCRNMGLAVGPETKLIELAMEERNSTRLEKLIARVKAKLQNSRLDTSSASQGSAASAAIAPHHDSIYEHQNRIQTHNAAIPYPAMRTSPEHCAEHASLATFPALPAYPVPAYPIIPMLPKTTRGPKARPTNILFCGYVLVYTLFVFREINISMR